MWWLLMTLLVAGIECTLGSLEGDYICPQQESYTVNVTKSVLKIIKLRKYRWCMNVPPRCSYYEDEERYVPTIEEEEVIRTVNKCCPGYHEDENGKRCIRSCPDCIHGECDLNNLCNCHPGFWGDICDKSCPRMRWGKSCESDCLCENGDCDPISGYCNCPPGWNGNRCEELISSSPTTSSFDQSTAATATTFLEKQNLSTLSTSSFSKASDLTKYPLFEKYYTFSITTENSLYTPKEESNWQKTTSTTNTKLTSVTWLTDRNHEETTIYNHIKSTSINTEQREGSSKTQPSTEVDTVSVPIAYNATVNPHEYDEAKQEQVFVNTTTEISDQVTQLSDANLKAKVVDDLEVSVTSTQNTIFTQEEKWFVKYDDSRVDPNNEVPIHQNQTTFDESSLVFSVGAVAGAIATIVLIIGIALFTTKNYRKKKAEATAAFEKSKNENHENGGHQVSIYTRSVFHAPLPDPPVFENPVFTTPVEYENNSTEFGGTLETHVICSMHLPNHSTTFRRDSRVVDAFYDHPPSTGSYRAASIPEPPEQSLEIANSDGKEHLYDEIPCWKQPLPINSTTNETLSYYANTRM